ncbi:MAG: serine/threonine protein kinase [Geodermatophilaceae bacterium]|nr:serine/threonine protein kinase [Geodermatophilaceae bacterium]
MQRRLDGFTLNELVGFGTTGEVWRARPQAGGPDVALKWLAADAIDPDKLEASGLSDFRHPHVAQLLDIRRDGNSVVLVHEFITGGSLAALLADRDRLSGSEVVTLLTPIAEALDAAHEAGLLHANLTPSAVLVTPDGRPMVTDVGIWQSLVIDSATRSGPTRLEYLDPCVARGGLPTKSSDVFGVAAIGYHALTGRPPWSAGTGSGNWELATDESGVDLGPLHSSSGTKLIEVIARGLSDRPECRGSARDFAADVRDAAEPEPLHLAGPYLWPDLPPAAAHDRPELDSAQQDSPGLDIASEVRRGRSARHAAPARRERVPCAGALGIGLDPPSRFDFAARLVPRRAVVSALACLAVLGVVILGLGWDSSKVVPAQAGAPIGAASGLTGAGVASTESDAGRLDERAVPDSAQGWASLLTMLYERRALAFSTGSVSLLEQVFTPDSPQLAADSTELTRLVQAGEVLRGFAPQVLEILDFSVAGDRASLRITDTFAAYDTVPASDTRAVAVAEYPGREPAQVTMTLVLSEQGWRILAAERLG